MENAKGIFLLYKEKSLYLSICKDTQNNFQDDSVSTENAKQVIREAVSCSDSYKESIEEVTKILTSRGLKLYRQQFKQFKYRQNNELVKLTVKKETYDKVRVLAKQYDGVNDLLFEYAFAKDHYLDTSVINDMPTSLTADEQLQVLYDTLDYRFKELIAKSEEKAYQEGFRLGQETKKIRSKKGFEEAVEQLNHCRHLDDEELLHHNKSLLGNI